MVTTSITIEDVLDGFERDVDCSQAVFGEFAPQFGLERETALKIAACFGCGMWDGDTCGAVTGALMTLGLKYGQGFDADEVQKYDMVAMADDFRQQFTEVYGSCICREILGCKLPEEMDRAIEEKKFETICGPLVVKACGILADILNDTLHD